MMHGYSYHAITYTSPGSTTRVGERKSSVNIEQSSNNNCSSDDGIITVIFEEEEDSDGAHNKETG